MALIAIILASLLAGFGSGWMIKDWKDGAEIAQLTTRNSIMSAANQRCETDIEAVRASVKRITASATAREDAAAKAMSNAQVLAAKHSATAIKIQSAPIVPEESMCDAIVREQTEYVQSRRDL